MLRAAGGGATPRLLAASAVAASVTGTTSETTLATITIPAGAMGLNGAVEVRTSWSLTNNANAKTARIRLGGAAGTQYLAVSLASSASYSDARRIRNRNSASSQVGSAPSAVSSFVASTGVLVTSSVDMSVAVDLVITGQLGVGTDTQTLEMYEVWLLP